MQLPARHTDAYAEIVRMGEFTILIFGLLLLAIGLFAYLLGHGIVKPLKRLSGEAGKVAPTVA